MSMDKQTDYLLLLVGGNPLPVYVSALMLANENTHVRLLHSPGKEVRNTARLADLLKKTIKSNVGCEVKTSDLNLVDRGKIQREIERLIGKIPEGKTVGFNYTGGTKSMVVYSIRKLEEKYQGNLALSYLNAQDKMLYVEYGRRVIEKYPAKLSDPIPLETILKLHGYEAIPGLRKEAKYLNIANVIIETQQTDEGIKEWKAWWHKELQENQLPPVEKYPHLTPFVECLHGEIENLRPEMVAQYFSFEKLVSCSKWFNGGWLEEYVFNAVKEIARRIGLHDIGIGLEPVPLIGNEDPENFELDIVALKNYQLFGISCIARSLDGGETKKHLLEIYVRTRQLGGDEARAALVYLGKNPQVVQAEIDRSWLPSNAIKVFGRDDLPNLKNHLSTWIRKNI